MPRPSKPWWWEERQAYFVKIDGKRVRLSEDRKEADQLFHKLKAEPEASKLHSDSVVAIIDAFLDDTSNAKAPATYDWYKSFLEPFARTVKHLRVHQLKPFHVKEWLAKESWGNSTQRGAITAVKRCFRWAMKEGRIRDNPVAYMEKPEAGKRDRILSPHEFKRLLSFVQDQQFRDVLEFAWETGARPQEVYALEGRHVELKNNRVVFPKEESKGKRRPRVIYLTAKARRIVARLMRAGHLFLNVGGEPFTKDSVNSRFNHLQHSLGKAELKRQEIEVDPKAMTALIPKLRRTKTSKGVELQKTETELRQEAKRKLTHLEAKKHAPKLCLYNLRHSFCHRMLKAGVDALTVSVLMGHQSPTVVATTYSNLSQANDYLLAALKRA